MTAYSLSKQGYIAIASYEAVSTQKYLDTSKVETIGLGSTASDIKDLHSWSWDTEITLQQAFDYFVNNMKPYVDAVNSALQHDVSQNQFDALVSITYNIGVSGTKHSTFMKLINAYGDNNDIDSAIRAWHSSGGKYSNGLMNRRNKEINMYENGVYPSNGTILWFPVSASHQPQYNKGKNINANDYLNV